MANKQVFGSSKRGKTPPPANTINEAGGRAYAFSEKHALAQYAATGTFNDAFYTTAEDQVDTVLRLCAALDPVYIAKMAVWSRESGYMKDMPALLCAHLTTRDGGGELLKLIFPRVIDNGKMLRNFVQIMVSGKLGRKSLGTMPKRLIQNWFALKSDEDIFRATVGNSPSLENIIKLAHPKPATESRRALLGYITGHKGVNEEHLPELVKEFELFKKLRATGANSTCLLPKVPMEMLQGLPLSESDWRHLAGQMSWTQTRMNLNSLAKHGVFKSQSAARAVADRLRNPELIRKARVFPYQLLVAYINTQPDRNGYGSYYAVTEKISEELPVDITNALQDAMEIAVENVLVPDGRIVVCPDVSGSMKSPVTGNRQGSTTKARCIDVAAMVASVYLRKAKDAIVLPFEGRVVDGVRLNPRDSIMTNADKLSKIGGGATNCAAPLEKLNRERAKVDLVIFVSDNESWVDSRRFGYGHGTGVMSEWNQLKSRNPKAKMVCIDIQPNGSTQAQEDKDILNIGGFSDKVFDTINQFLSGTLTNEHWVGIIEAIQLTPQSE